jgi:hypothetical protein
MFLIEKKPGKHKGRLRGAETTYEQAAKKAKSQVLGSLNASMNLTHHGSGETIIRTRERMGRDPLLFLECLVFHTSLVTPDSNDDFDPLLWGQEPGIGRGIGEEEPENYRGDEG